MKALIITDVQHDFLPGGSLPVSKGDEIIPIINQITPHFDHVFATLDWHPPHHVSFASTHKKRVGEVIQIQGREQILWPDHCVQDTFGAQLSEKLDQKAIEKRFYKGSDPEIDSYSAFFDNARKRSTGLGEYLRKGGFQCLYFVGLATDYCVLYSGLDALDLGFNVFVIHDACRAINLHPLDEKRAFEKMQRAGVKLIASVAISHS